MGGMFPTLPRRPRGLHLALHLGVPPLAHVGVPLHHLRIAPPVVQRLFRQTQRVGAVLVFDDGDGRALPLVNARARAPLPPGFVDTLARALEALVR